jgi:hypothetical protein
MDEVRHLKIFFTFAVATVNRQDRKDLSHRLTVMRHQASHPLNRLANKMVGMRQNVAAAIAQANRYKL